MQKCHRLRQASTSLACALPSSSRLQWPRLRRYSAWSLERRQSLHTSSTLRRGSNVILAPSEQIEADTAVGRQKSYLFSRQLGSQWNEISKLDPGEIQLRKLIKVHFDGLEYGEDFVRRDKLVQGLETLGYSPDDLKLWESIILSEDAAEASALLCDTIHRPVPGCKAVPSAIVMRLLKNTRTSTEALQLILHYVGHISTTLATAEKDPSRPNLVTHARHLRVARWMRVLDLLLERCRQIWPEAIPAVVSIFIQVCDVIEQASTESSLETPATALGRAYVTSLANQWIQNLARPTKEKPLAYISLRKSAQFDILRWMDSFRPTLPITREGYRGIIATQLASPKSESERDWTDMQSPTWPPWKVDRSGLDVDKDREYGASGAFRAIQRAREAGYGDEAFENVAQILSGWDIDQTPTIQTRAKLSLDSINQQWNADVVREEQPLVWAARIRATRTVEEAWAAFLSWRSLGLSPNQAVYFEMLDKIAAEERRKLAEKRQQSRRTVQPTTSSTRPGEGMEVLKASQSPKETVYIPEKVPLLNELAAEMQKLGIFPDQGFYLNFFLMNASSLSDGCDYVRFASQTQPEIASLLDGQPRPAAIATNSKAFRHSSLTAFVKLLCRFPRAYVTLNDGQEGHRTALEHALTLIKSFKPGFELPWHHVLHCLSQASAADDAEMPNSGPAQVLQRFETMRSLRRSMKQLDMRLDSSAFVALCQGLQNATIAARRIQTARPEARYDKRRGKVEQDARPLAEAVLKDGFGYIRRLFYELMGTRDSRMLASHFASKKPLPVPELNTVPHGVILHSFARCCGLSGDWHGMLEFARWLFAHRESIEEATQHTANGTRLVRRTIVAMVAFSERGVAVDYGSWAGPSYVRAPDKTASKVREILQHCTYLGGLPSQREIDEYVSRSYPGVFE